MDDSLQVSQIKSYNVMYDFLTSILYNKFWFFTKNIEEFIRLNSCMFVLDMSMGV